MRRKAIFNPDAEEDDVDLSEEEGPKTKGKKKSTSAKSAKSSWGAIRVDASFLKFYEKLGDPPKDLVRFFFRKEFYSVYGDNANFIAEEIFNTRKVVQTPDKGPPYVNIKPNQFQEICRELLLEKKWNVEVYSNESGKWELWKSASPGNLVQLEDILFNEDAMVESQVMLAVNLVQVKGTRIVGVAFVDLVLRNIGTMEFNDNERLTNLESLFYQVSAKECLCPPLDAKDKDNKRMHELLEKLDIKVTAKKKSEFKTQT